MARNRDQSVIQTKRVKVHRLMNGSFFYTPGLPKSLEGARKGKKRRIKKSLTFATGACALHARIHAVFGLVPHVTLAHFQWFAFHECALSLIRVCAISVVRVSRVRAFSGSRFASALFRWFASTRFQWFAFREFELLVIRFSLREFQEKKHDFCSLEGSSVRRTFATKLSCASTETKFVSCQQSTGFESSPNVHLIKVAAFILNKPMLLRHVCKRRLDLASTIQGSLHLLLTRVQRTTNVLPTLRKGPLTSSMASQQLT